MWYWRCGKEAEELIRDEVDATKAVSKGGMSAEVIKRHNRDRSNRLD